MFQGLSEKLQETFKKLRGKGKLNEADVTAAMREVRMALLEADVNFKVVKDFVAKVKERAVGAEVLESLSPAQQVVKIVHEELIALMGGAESKIQISPKPPTIIMLVGLQGAGKTTHAAKLASLLKKQGKHPLMVACDIYRPAAVKQLEVLGEQIKVPVFAQAGRAAAEIARAGAESALRQGADVLIIDTAGRLHINEELMGELQEIKAQVQPQEILLVVDAMTGQDAVNVAETFHARLGLDGVILTKLDGDTRGGAALSVRAVTGCPIKFAGVGEKIEALEAFYPDRMASRILGMGDVLTLIEKAQQAFDEKKAAEMQQKLRKQEFSLEDFLEQMQQLKKMGPLASIMEMIPGIGKQLKDVTIDEKDMAHVEAIIRSMTPDERRKPSIIKDSRKRRIAKGSGTSIQEVGRLLKQFEQMQKMMKQFAGGLPGGLGKGKKGKRAGLPFVR
ncbi:Signal recognition particle, SRP54 subunit, M-domain protein [Acididesulfobacillus acetoxydans]|uniref:Signal recognition particle protein n=1 Tax=Acididesulfobacillus acetoxydans TaxID=1561005 RepID=A0A8S0XCP6_9FIRM|nr:signal recognition particle protein [Acididesulfobacillus acetoxydans]CAA7602716.1 Signal recognition particle, SRP54 subunit, M-domain protein [Acididesulfobacillus acetoxydans]CEJ06427.1 Signal recognition particle protein [Acididesulfobacillus acetoxydans]